MAIETKTQDPPTAEGREGADAHQADGAADASEEQQGPQLTGHWLDLNTAAKDWLRANHAEVPTELKKDQTDDYYDDLWPLSGWNDQSWSTSKKKKKKKRVSPEQVEIVRLRCGSSASARGWE
eukprot:scaffold1188_cov255-Pinguiococcus_pyrenoidosus.AAC.5